MAEHTYFRRPFRAIGLPKHALGDLRQTIWCEVHMPIIKEARIYSTLIDEQLI